MFERIERVVEGSFVYLDIYQGYYIGGYWVERKFLLGLQMILEGYNLINMFLFVL